MPGVREYRCPCGKSKVHTHTRSWPAPIEGRILYSDGTVGMIVRQAPPRRPTWVVMLAQDFEES